MATVTNGYVTFNPGELAETCITYRKELLTVPFRAMAELLQHVNTRQGIRYREVVSKLTGNAQFGNYSKTKKGEGAVTIQGRLFETYFGNVIEPMDPNAIYQSIWGSDITKGEKLKDTEIARAIATYMVKKIWENVLNVSFTAAHDATNTTESEKWFNGFKTVIDNDIAGTNYTSEVLISEDLGNLQLGTESITKENAEDIIKDFYWSRDAKLRAQKTKLFVSDMTYHYYTEAYQLNHGALPYNLAYDKKTLDGASNVEFVPLSFVPTDFMLLTPKQNIYALFNAKTEDETYLVERSLDNHYDLDFLANAFFGTQFEMVDKEMLSVWEYSAGE